MDEYKECIYQRQIGRYKRVDPGDLTKSKAIREKLKCKSFKWYMEEIAFDSLAKYPPIVPHIAWGSIRNEHNRNSCIDDLSVQANQNIPIGVYHCGAKPQPNQQFVVNFDHSVQTLSGYCWELTNQNQVTLKTCRNHVRQRWNYDQVRFIGCRMLTQYNCHLSHSSCLCSE